MKVPQWISTERLQLRRHVRDDVDAFASFMTDPAATRYMAFTTEQMTRAGAEGMLDWVISNYESDRPLFSLTIADRDSGRYVGSCGAHPCETGLEIYYTILPNRQGRGLATEATLALVEYLFTVTDVERLVAHVVPENTASVRVAAKIGFVDDGPLERPPGTGDLRHAALAGRRYLLTRQTWLAGRGERRSVSRRAFLASSVLAAGTLCGKVSRAADPAPGDRPLMKPVHDMIVCPWTPQHPRHDHQLIFPLDAERLLLVWSEYYTQNADPSTRKGHSGAGDAVSCQIASMVSRDGGRTWDKRRVMQPNVWQKNVKHPNLVRLSDSEILFSYVGWDSDTQRNVYMRRSLDGGRTWGEQVQISEPGWYCNNADRALRLSTGRVILPAHGPFAEKYIGGTAYRGGHLHSFVFYSDDGFHTWRRSTDSMTAPGRGCHEPTIVELTDGRLYCLLRNTNQRQYFSISDDGGDHWTEPAPGPLASPEAPALVKRIPTTGDLLVLWNNVASQGNWPRIPLCAAISRDEGRSWTHVRDVDNRPNRDAAYPSVTFVGDEALVAYYSRSTAWKRDSEITLRIYKIDEFYA